jgi:inosine/xanthosine triphosphate pyrophosphatase family protein
MFNVQDDHSGNRLTGKNLTEVLLKPFYNNCGYVTSSVYGIAQKPSMTDASRKIIATKPSINFAHHDDVQISQSPSFQLFNESYHGLLMAFPYLNYGQFCSLDGKILFSSSSCVGKSIHDALAQIIIPDPMILAIGILTTNHKKVKELEEIVEYIFGRLAQQHGQNFLSYRVIIEQIPFVSMVEEQILDPVVCTESKIDNCRLSVEQIGSVLGKQCIFIDDTSFAVEALNMQPGTFYKQHYEKGEIDAKAGKGIKYNNFICDMVNTQMSKNGNRIAYATTIFACVFSTPWGTVLDSIMWSSVEGTISETPKAKDNSVEFGWDPIFIPKSNEMENRPDVFELYTQNLTYQQMDKKMWALSKPRGFALKKTLMQVLGLTKGVIFPPEKYNFGMSIAEQKDSTENMAKALAIAGSLVQNKQIVVQNNSSSAVNNSTMRAVGACNPNDIMASLF